MPRDENKVIVFIEKLSRNLLTVSNLFNIQRNLPIRDKYVMAIDIIL